MSEFKTGCAINLQVTFFGDRPSHFWPKGQSDAAAALALWARRVLGRPPSHAHHSTSIKLDCSHSDRRRIEPLGALSRPQNFFTVRVNGPTVSLVPEYLLEHTYTPIPSSIPLLNLGDLRAFAAPGVGFGGTASPKPAAASKQPDSLMLKLLGSMTQFGACKVRI